MKQYGKIYGKNTQWEGFGTVETVPCTTLDELLQRMHVRKVDYFSLDVEGAELHILQSLDWPNLDIEV